MTDFATAYGAKIKERIDFSDDPGRTKQAFRDECDVNLIIKKYDRQGILTHLNKLEAQYGDVSGVDFQAALDLVTRTRGFFEQLPSSVRRSFGNDPANFLDFCDNPANADRLVEMGVASRQEVDELVTSQESRRSPGPRDQAVGPETEGQGSPE